MSVNVRNQRKALEALLSTNTIEQAAAACGLASKTISRYLADPDFAAELVKREGLLLSEAGRVLLSGQHEALQVLRDIMTGELSKDNDKRLAAVAWLDYCLRFRDLKIEERLSRLERLHEIEK